MAVVQVVEKLERSLLHGVAYEMPVHRMWTDVNLGP